MLMAEIENFDCPDCGGYANHLATVWHILEAKQAGAEIFLSLCNKLLDNRDAVETLFNIKIRRPTELLKEIHESDG